MPDKSAERIEQKGQQLLLEKKISAVHLEDLVYVPELHDPAYVLLDRDCPNDNYGPNKAMHNEKMLDALLAEHLTIDDVLALTNESYNVLINNEGIWSWVLSGDVSIKDLSHKIACYAQVGSFPLIHDFQNHVNWLTKGGVSQLFELESIRNIYVDGLATAEQIAQCSQVNLASPLNQAILAAFAELNDFSCAYHKNPNWDSRINIRHLLAQIAKESKLGWLLQQVVKSNNQGWGFYDKGFMTAVSSLVKAHYAICLDRAFRKTNFYWLEHDTAAKTIQRFARKSIFKPADQAVATASSSIGEQETP